MLNDIEVPYCQEYLDKIQSISLDNKYTKWYLALCRKAALRGSDKKSVSKLLGGIETHHIVPKSFGLVNHREKLNCVHFTYREHFLAHRIIVVCLPKGKQQNQMQAALWRLIHDKDHHKISSKIYSRLRANFILTSRAPERLEALRKGHEKRRGRARTEAEKIYDYVKRGRVTANQRAAYENRKLRPPTELEKIRDAKRKGIKVPNRKPARITEKHLKYFTRRRNEAILDSPQEINPEILVDETLELFGYNPRFLKTYSELLVIRKYNCCGKIAQKKFHIANKRNKCFSCTIHKTAIP